MIDEMSLDTAPLRVECHARGLPEAFSQEAIQDRRFAELRKQKNVDLAQMRNSHLEMLTRYSEYQKLQQEREKDERERMKAMQSQRPMRWFEAIKAPWYDR